MSTSLKANENEFGFPFRPYGIQVDFMKNIQRTLNESGKDNVKHVTILASPTGTGKSLSLICGLFDWYFKNPLEHFPLEDDTICSEDEDDSMNVGSKENVPQWIRDHLKNRKLKEIEQHRQDYLAVLDKLKRYNTSKHSHKRKSIDYEDPDALSGPSDLEKQRRLFQNAALGMDNENIGQDFDVEATDSPPKQLQIIYASRTHSQLSQFIEELNKTQYGSKVTVVHLGSRAQLCINPKVNKSASVTIMNDKCKDLLRNKSGCCYKSSEKMEEYRNAVLFPSEASSTCDIEDLFQKGKKMESCPYYGARTVIPFVQVVVLPYSMLLSKDNRTSFGLDISKSIVVVDEAHNIIDSIEELHKVILSQKSLIRVETQLNEYVKKYRSNFNGENLVKLKQIISVVKRLCSYLQKKKPEDEERAFVINDFLLETRLDNMNMFILLDFIRSSGLCRKLIGFGIPDSSNEEGPDYVAKNCSPLVEVEAFFDRMAKMEEHGRVLVQKDDQGQFQLKYLLLDPSMYFKDVVKEARCVFLAGGTMDPADDYISQLLPFAKELNVKVDMFSCNHVIPEENLKTFLLDTGHGNVKFDFSFSKRGDLALKLAAGDAVMNMSKIIPGGLVVFFSSFNLMFDMMEAWKHDPLWTTMKNHKDVYIEPRNNKETDAVLQKYKESIDSGKGAILCCVVGGKLSEGINFKDKYGRGVIVFGLPFPPSNSIEIIEKMKYLNSMSDTSNSKGSAYYENICMKA
ncbi:hypothetical protein MP638_004233, partial [Amoeboaphelidium occidentale]